MGPGAPKPGRPASVAFPPVTPVAYLRAYLPGDQLEVVEHLASAPSRVMVRGRYGMWCESSRDDAFVIEHRGRRYVCPRHPRLRMLEGLLAFRNAYPAPAGRFLVPEAMARRAAEELEEIRSRQPGTRSHILGSPFHVPPRWFAAFDPKERRLVSTPAGLTIRYRTAQRSALRRLQKAVRVLEAASFDEAVVGQIEELVDWVRAFPGEALLELDYGGVAGLFSEGELATDESAAEVAASLEALHRGDPDEAGEQYSRVAGRWFRAQSLTFAS
jgi:hypothetical protein